MRIQVKNWKDKNPRGFKRATWLKIYNDLVFGTKNLDLDGNDILAFLYILTQCSTENSDTITINPIHYQVFGRTTKDALFISIDKLIKKSIICSHEETIETIDVGGQDAIVFGRDPPPRLDKIRVDKSRSIGDDSKDFEIIPELKLVEEILLGRKISKDLQWAWLDSYTAEFIIQKVRDLRVWELTAGAKGKKKNWGRFYNGCFAKDWDRWSRSLPSSQKSEMSDWAKTKLKEEQAKNG